MDWLKRDLRVGLRLLAKDKAFSVTAVLTLAICIGANTALFAVVYNVLLRPLPVSEPERILLMSNQYPKAGVRDSVNSGVPDYYDRMRETRVFEEQALFNHTSLGIGQAGFPTRVRVANVTPSFFRLMQVAPALGRTFTEQEGEVGNENKVVLSDALWHTQFGGDPRAVGQALRLDDQAYEVVGIMPGSFQALDPGVMLWRPVAFTPEERSDGSRHSNNYWNVGRLKPGATLREAQAQIDALNAANLERFSQYKELLLNSGFHTRVEGFQDRLVSDVKPTLFLLWGGALFVLLIGCVNVANLALVRASTRLKELATRFALGAARGQVARQLVVESVVLMLIAAAAGLLLGAAALRMLGGLNLEDLPYGSEIRPDAVVVLFTLLASTAIGIALGLVPMASVPPAKLTLLLREEGRSSTGGRRARALRRSLVVSQVAFTFVLLLGAGLLLASFRKVLRVDPGFASTRVLTASVALPRTRYADEGTLRSFTDAALTRVRALPGVLATGATDTIPFGDSNSDSVILAEGYQMKPGESVISPNSVHVTPGYFEAMGVKLRSGRLFRDSDEAGAQPVIIVDEKLAGRFWPGQDPVGRRMYRPTDINDLLAVNEKTVFLTVVGVVGEVKLHDLTEGERRVGSYYFPVAQEATRLLTFAIKTAVPPKSIATSLRKAIAALDPELPVFDLHSMDERVDRALRNRRAPATLALAFGFVALLLSAVGLYGVLAYLVAQRTREIGIRIALGSSARAVFELVLREGLLLVGAGFLLGAAFVLALRRSLESQLFGVQATDPLVVGGVATLLGAVALLACSLPARRATRIDPMVVLAQ